MSWTVAIGVDTHKDVHVAVACDRLGTQVGHRPEPLRRRLEHLPAAKLAVACARLRASATATAVVAGVLKRPGQRVRMLEHERLLIDSQLEQLVRELAPQLLDEPGIGPHSAAQLLVSSGDPTRMRREAAFAALAGTSPVDASSGNNNATDSTATATANSTAPST